uniref:Uncharacterized protein n=1 Tax=Steinernema glaseri TaxID=37863 RepID=A0A1I7Y2Y9_9BILA
MKFREWSTGDIKRIKNRNFPTCPLAFARRLCADLNYETSVIISKERHMSLLNVYSIKRLARIKKRTKESQKSQNGKGKRERNQQQINTENLRKNNNSGKGRCECCGRVDGSAASTEGSAKELSATLSDAAIR